MQITPRKHTISAVAVAAALCAPVAAQAKDGHGHLNGHGHGHGLAAEQLPEAPAQPDGPRAPKGPKMANVIVKGDVVSVNGNVVTVAVAGSNHHGRALKGLEVQLDVTNARIRVKDVNADGSHDSADVAAGDRVLAQVRVPRRTTPDLTQPFAARKLIDVGPVHTLDSGDAGEQPEG